jgi:hypothetical protein
MNQQDGLPYNVTDGDSAEKKNIGIKAASIRGEKYLE